MCSSVLSDLSVHLTYHNNECNVSVVLRTQPYILNCLNPYRPSFSLIRGNLGPVHLYISTCRCTSKLGITTSTPAPTFCHRNRIIAASWEKETELDFSTLLLVTDTEFRTCCHNLIINIYENIILAARFELLTAMFAEDSSLLRLTPCRLVYRPFEGSSGPT